MNFTLAGNVSRYDGYGLMTMKLGEALRPRGHLVCNLGALGKRAIELYGPAVVACPPDWLRQPQLGVDAEQTLILTMFETDRIPDYWVEIINGLAGCIVPEDWNRRLFERCGVTVPIFTAPLGIDRWEYPLMARERNATHPYTFLWSGTPGRRKGWEIAYRTFRRAFGDRRDVRMVMHFRSLPDGMNGALDENVEIVEGRLLHSEWLLLLRRADCFVFPSRGEGWGLPPREAAATGLPVIATNWSGLAADIEAWGIPLSVSGMINAEHGFWDDLQVGRWAQPDEVHLEELMQLCESRRDEDDAGWGARASAWLSQQTWSAMADRVEAAVEEVLG